MRFSCVVWAVLAAEPVPSMAVSGTAPVLASVRGVTMGVPLAGVSPEEVLARSLEYTSRDVVRDGLPHFGAARDDWMGRLRRHLGIDIYLDGLPVLAAAGGRVVGLGGGTRAGGWLKLSHGHGVETVYVHLRAIKVRKGMRVQAGQPLAQIDGPVGNAVEPQLHFEIKIDGRSVDPVPFISAASPTPELRTRWEVAVRAIPGRTAARAVLVRTGQRQGRGVPR